MNEAIYQLDLHLQAPILTQASGTFRFGTDTAMQIYQNKPVLNGSLVRGNLRHALNLLLSHLEGEQKNRLEWQIKQWFGPPAKREADDRFDTQRAKLRFDFFWQVTNPEAIKRGKRTRIKIDATGTVEDGALQVIEDWFPVGSHPVFSGLIRVTFDRDTEGGNAEQEDFERWINKALSTIPALGSLKGIGYGRLIQGKLVDCTRHPCTKAYTQDKLPGHMAVDKQRFGITLYLDRPLCIGKPRTNDSNRIVSSEHIPGNVLKAVLAEPYVQKGQQEALMAMHFDQLQFSHAQPYFAKGQRLSQPIPLSLALYKTGPEDDRTTHVIDLADLMEPLEGPPECPNWQETRNGQLHELVPVFQMDWKKAEQDHAARLYPETRPKRWLTVRTEIKPDGSNISAQGNLFSTECTDTVDAEGRDLIWQGSINVSRVPTEQQNDTVAKLRADLSRGLRNIGKTKANARVEISPLLTRPCLAKDQLKVGQRVIVTLMSEARLLPLNLEQYDMRSTDSQRILKTHYEQYWGNDLKLKQFYAQQTRAGGEFYYRKFQKSSANSDYCPEWLTVAGSVFVLEILQPAAIKALIKWQQQGLPVCHPANSTLPEPNWKNTAYLPEHGFGEITLRLQQNRQNPAAQNQEGA